MVNYRMLVNHKLTPLTFTNMDKCWMAICKITYSVQKVPGSLVAYQNDRQTSFKSHQWNKQLAITLTEREKDILTLAKQGRSTKTIAGILCSSYQTVLNQENKMYKKIE